MVSEPHPLCTSLVPFSSRSLLPSDILIGSSGDRLPLPSRTKAHLCQELCFIHPTCPVLRMERSLKLQVTLPASGSGPAGLWTLGIFTLNSGFLAGFGIKHLMRLPICSWTSNFRSPDVAQKGNENYLRHKGKGWRDWVKGTGSPSFLFNSS